MGAGPVTAASAPPPLCTDSPGEAVHFQITDRAAAGRLGRFRTPHGTVTTPTLMPVVNPNIDLVSPREMRDRFGCEMVITNSYVIRKHADLRERALAEGVHRLLDWDGPVMTDSGTFQMYVYGDVEVAPEDIVAFQRDMGVDVATCLDIFVTPEMTRSEAEAAVQTTLERTRAAARTLHGGDGGLAPDGLVAAEATPAADRRTLLNATVQGGVHLELRQRCAESLRTLDVDYHTIGGVVPLMQEQRYPELVDVIIQSQAMLRKDRPVHLFGAGHPLVFPLAVALGCDLFDSSSYAKYAKDDRIMTTEGTLHLADLAGASDGLGAGGQSGTEWPFASRFLEAWTPKELAAATKKERQRALALHNLDVCFTDIRRIRQAIRDGQLWELVEQRAACHPLLAHATRKLGDPEYQAWLEAREPLSGRKALKYTGGLTHRRPTFHRIRHRLVERVVMQARPVEIVGNAWCEDGAHRIELGMHKEPAGDWKAAMGELDREQEHVAVTALGPVPLGLQEAYPFAQSLLPRLEGLDPQHMEWVGDTKDLYLERHGCVPTIPGPPLPDEALDWARMQVIRTADWQFGAGAGAALTGETPAAAALTGENPAGADGGDADGGDADGRAPSGDRLRVEHSRKTGKLRRVHLDGEHILSLRAGDGLWTLKAAGARILHAALPAPALRVEVEPDSVPFNRDGKSVFAKFVVGADGALRPGDECLVVGPDDDLAAVGRVLLTAEEMGDFGTGMAVQVREGI